MPDNPNKRGKSDRSKVSKQYHEQRHIVNRYNVSPQQLTGAISVVGNNRAKIMAYLREKGVIKK